MLFEREDELHLLQSAVRSAEAGLGQTVIVTGEAGAGKSALLQTFARTVTRAGLHWGGSEALFTPRPLGPLRDMADGLDRRLATLIEEGARQDVVFPALLRALQEARQPQVLIFEDVHWADNATLDLIKYLGRRIAYIRVMLVLSLRTEELDSDHPMAQVLGDLPSGSTQRLAVGPLSVESIAALAKASSAEARELHRITGGNPFFATELIAAGAAASGQMPLSVRDAVWARMQRLRRSEREVLEALSINPAGTDPWLADALLGRDTAPDVDVCLSRGLLIRDEEGRLQFRHEIARSATLERLSASACKALHQKAFRALADCADAQLATLVHHASGAGDAENVLLLARRAAGEAIGLGAHREAARHLATAINYVKNASPEVAAQLYEDWSYEAALGLTISDEMIAAAIKAIGIWRGLVRPEKVAHNLRWLSRLTWLRGESATAARYIDEAIETLKGAPPSRELALVYSNRGQLYMFNDRFEEARDWSRRAIALAAEVGDIEARIHALNNLAGSYLFAGSAEGKPYMEESLALALEHRFHDHASRAYTNYIEYAVLAKDFALAERLIGEGLAFNSRHDLDGAVHVLTGRQAHLRLDQGQLLEAEQIARAVVEKKSLAFIVKLPALFILARARMRLGRDDGPALLRQSMNDALLTGEQQHLVPARLGLIEQAWLTSDTAAAQAELRHFAALHLDGLDGWDLGSFAVWWQRCGMTEAFPADTARIAAPRLAELRGNIGEAVSLWQKLGLPYEAALALMAAPAGYARATALLDDMGAVPAAALARRLAAQAGIKLDAKRARGPYEKARKHPLGLTGRQAEVFEQLARGLSNHEIAEALDCSIRTVENHVSAILGKLNAANRIEVMLRLRNEPWLAGPSLQ